MEAIPRALVCVDFDGTLIDPGQDPAVPVELEHRIEAFGRQGVVWAICTGRSLFQAVAGITDHGLRVVPEFLVTSERELYKRTRYNRWAELGRWNSRCAKAHRKLFRSHGRFLKRVRSHVEATTSARYVDHDGEAASIVATHDEEMDRICRFLEEQLPRTKGLGYERNSVYLRFSHADYSKGSTVRELARVLGLPPDRVLAIGDNYNDLSMMTPAVAGMIACPANAVPAVKTAVAEAGGHVGEGASGWGVLEAIEHFLPKIPPAPPDA